MIRSVAVIGAGPAGLVTVKELKESGSFDSIVCFEQSSAIGGRWSFSPSNRTGVWDELCLNINRRLMSFSDFEWKENYYEGSDRALGGVYPHCTETKAYLQDYCKHFEITQHVVFNTRVISVERDGSSWKIMTSTKTDNSETKVTHYQFDALIVCSGVYGNPRNPLLAMTNSVFKGYSGEMIHSQDFVSAKKFENKRVMVFGSSRSATDCCEALAIYGNCKKIINCVRSIPYHYSNLSLTESQPSDDYLFTRLPVWMAKVLPESIMAEYLKAKILHLTPDQLTEGETGVRQHVDVRVSGICPDRCFVQHVHAGRIKVIPSLISSTEDLIVRLQDGTEEEIDCVIFATGYDIDLSFLDEELKKKVVFYNNCSGRDDLALYKRMLVPEHKNIAFCGLLYNSGPHFPMAEVQARYITAIFSGKLTRPSESTIRRSAEESKILRSSSRLSTFDVYTKMCESIGDELGITPSFFERLMYPSKYLLGPVYPCNYRRNPIMEGEEKARQGQALFDFYIENPQANNNCNLLK